jgi:hypothetical protein
LVAQPFDVFGDGDDLLEVLVLAAVPDGVVDYDAIDGGIRVGGEDCFFNVVGVDLAELELEATREVSERERRGWEEDLSLQVLPVQSA